MHTPPKSRDQGLYERNRGSKCWWIRWSCGNGHIHRERVGAHSLAKETYDERKRSARLYGFCLAEHRQQLKARKQQPKPLLFREAADAYIRWAAKERPKSLRFRQNTLNPLLSTFGEQPLAAITPAQITQYLQRRRDAGLSGSTCNRERSVLGHLFSRAILWGYVMENPAARTEKYREPKGTPRPLTYDEEARLFQQLPAHYRPFVLLAIESGLRLNELRTQLWRDIDLEKGILTVSSPKSGKPDEGIPLNATAKGLLSNLERTGKLVFPKLPRSLSTTFPRYLRRAKIEGASFHCLRDTFCSRVAAHASAATLRALARHQDLRTTQRYVQVDDSHLRAAVEKLDTDRAGSADFDTLLAPAGVEHG